MKLITACVICVLLSGCGTYGEPLLLARMIDAQDVCQQDPSIRWCGAGTGPVLYVRSGQTGNIRYTIRGN